MLKLEVGVDYNGFLKYADQLPQYYLQSNLLKADRVLKTVCAGLPLNKFDKLTVN